MLPSTLAAPDFFIATTPANEVPAVAIRSSDPSVAVSAPGGFANRDLIPLVARY